VTGSKEGSQQPLSARMKGIKKPEVKAFAETSKSSEYCEGFTQWVRPDNRSQTKEKRK
jgi:hypothetical protein